MLFSGKGWKMSLLRVVISINKKEVLFVRVMLFLLPPPHIIDHIWFGVIAVGVDSVLLAEHSGGGLFVEALLFLEKAELFDVRFHEERALVFVLLLVDDLAHGLEGYFAIGGIGNRKGVADALSRQESTLRVS